MELNSYNINKWRKMLFGKSVWHVNQDVGRHINLHSLYGYYNDLTEKVLMDPELSEGLPVATTEKGEKIFFPVAVFQYGLGAYDLYLETGYKEYFDSFVRCAKWAFEKQEESGAWNNFFYIFPDHPYGSMAQGEGASLLLRAYKETEDDRYLAAAKKALEFMIKPIEAGGTAEIVGEDIILHEYTNGTAVLNGWIFSLFGLYDYCLVSNDNNNYMKFIFEASGKTLANRLNKFHLSYWSLYNFEGVIASPFYHHLHIALLDAMFMLTAIDDYKYYADLWRSYEKKRLYKGLAFVKKAIQKVKK